MMRQAAFTWEQAQHHRNLHCQDGGIVKRLEDVKDQYRSALSGVID